LQSVTWFDEFAYEVFYPFNATNEPGFPNNGPDQTRKRFTLGAQDTMPLLSGRVLLVPSLRYEHLIDEFSGVSTLNMVADSPPQTQSGFLDARRRSPGAVGPVDRTALRILDSSIGHRALRNCLAMPVASKATEPQTRVGHQSRRRLRFTPRFPVISIASTSVRVLSQQRRRSHHLRAGKHDGVQSRQHRRCRVAGHEVSLSTAAFSHLGLEANYASGQCRDRRPGDQIRR
jgi:hypothetical protein